MSRSWRAGLELAAVGGAAALFLCLLPRRPVALDAGLALLAGALGIWHARRTDRAASAEPGAPPPAGRAWAQVLVGTVAGLVVFGAVGGLDAWRVTGRADAVAGRLLVPSLPVALVLFVPWAWLQQALLQRWVLGRLRAWLPQAPPPALAALAGTAFGLVHLPAVDLAVVTTVGGAGWAWFYLRDRLLAPLALSHALLGPAYFYWVRGEDLAGRWLTRLLSG